MKISVALHDPLRCRSHGPQPLGHVCRNFLSMGSAAVEFSDSPGERPQLWWNPSGPIFSIDSFPPDDHLFFSDKAKLSDMVQEGENCIKPPLPDCLPAEQIHQKHLPAQVNPSPSQAQHLDRTEMPHEHSIQRNGNTVIEEWIDHSRLPGDADFLSSDGESHPPTAILMSECHCENGHLSEEALETPASARVKLMCSFGGRIMPRPVDGKLRYVAGETRIIAVNKHISFAEFMSKMKQVYGAPLGLKYQLPDEDLDALVSVSSDDDLQNMMEEYDKGRSSGSASRLRLFFFSTPAEVEVVEMKMDEEDGFPFPDQRYVDAINGVLGKLHVNLLEGDADGLRQLDGGNTVEGSGRIPSFEHVNETSQSKGPSAPSSSPSSPSLASCQASYHKPPGLVEFSLQNLNEHFNKVTMPFDGDVEIEGLASASSTPFHPQNDHHQFDQQFSLAADSSRVLHHDFLNSRGGENWPGLRHVDSQTKLVRQSEQYGEYRTNVGGPSDHWHEIHHSHDTVSPQGEHQRLMQQHKHSIPSQQHHHHQQQHHHQQLPYHHYQQQPTQQQPQGWYAQIDVDSGRAEQSHQDMHKQQQVVHLHHQPPHHLHHNASMHDQCSWNAEYHARSVEHNAVPPFIHGSTQINPQILHGLAPAPPYQLGSAPPSPKGGVYDLQGKCSCGLQHSQVHRGITVSIGEQSHARWPPHYGDQPGRKQSFWNSSRFNDNASYTADSSLWQQASHPSQSTVMCELEHRELTNSQWQHYLGRQMRDFHLVHDREFQPTHDRPEMNKRCLCINCLDSRRQPMEVMTGHTAYVEASDQVPEWLLHQKGFDLDGGRVSSARKPSHRVPVYKEENQRVDFIDDRFIDGECGLYVSQPPGESESRRAMPSFVEGVVHGRKPAISVGILPCKFPVSDDPLVSQPSVQGPSDWHPLVKASMEVPESWTDKRLSQQVQNLSRLMEASNICSGQEVTRMSLASSTPVMLEEVDNSTQTALTSDMQHRNYGASTSHSFYREENNMPVSVGIAASEAPVHWSATSGIEYVELGANGPKMPAPHRDSHLLSPDVIPLAHISLVSVASHSGQTVPSPALLMSNVEQTTSSPNHDQSPFSSSSVNMMDFSFAAGKTGLPPSETNTEKNLYASCISSTETSADGITSSVLECCSKENLPSKISDADPVDSQKVLEDQGIISEVESSNTLKLSVTEQAKGLSIEGASIGNGCLGAITEEGTHGIHTAQSNDLEKKSYQEKDSEAGIPGTEDGKNPALSEAEAEAISRGLQIIKNSDLEDLKELGSGTYGTVFHGKWRGSDVAIKRIKASCFNGPPSERERLISDFWREACMLGQLHHPNVVAFYGVVPDGPGGTLATVTEYMVNGSLKQVLHKKDRTIDRRKRLFIAMDAAFGMEYLHSKNIVHFDLKCENLLVNMRDAHRPICKVGDFGLSKVKHQTLVSGGVRGTLPWMAPELLSGDCRMVSDKIDVFSFGIVMWELLTGEEPYANMHCGAIIGGIVNNTLRPAIPSWCDPGWRSLMERCWSGNPAERPAFAEVSRELRAIAATMNLK